MGSQARLAYIIRTSMMLPFGLLITKKLTCLLPDQSQKLTAQIGIAQERAAHDAVDHFRLSVLDAAPVHAEMIGFHHDGQTIRLQFLHEQIGNLGDGFFLDLRTPHDPLDQTRILGQADQVGMFVGHHADPDFAHNRAKVMRASAAHCDRTDDHQFIQTFDIREFGHRRRRLIATAEYLLHIHLGYALGGVLRVVVALDIDHQALKHARQLGLYFGLQGLQLTFAYEFGNVVVGVKTYAGGLDARTDARRYQFVVHAWSWLVCCHYGIVRGSAVRMKLTTLCPETALLFASRDNAASAIEIRRISTCGNSR